MSEEFEELPFDEEKKPEESSDQSTISIFFENSIGPGNKQEKLDVNSQIPVIDLKFTLSQVFSLPSDEFHLIFDGRILDDEDIISNFDIKDGDVVLIIPVTTAGLTNKV